MWPLLDQMFYIFMEGTDNASHKKKTIVILVNVT